MRTRRARRGRGGAEFPKVWLLRGSTQGIRDRFFRQQNSGGYCYARCRQRSCCGPRLACCCCCWRYKPLPLLRSQRRLGNPSSASDRRWLRSHLLDLLELQETVLREDRSLAIGGRYREKRCGGKSSSRLERPRSPRPMRVDAGGRASAVAPVPRSIAAIAGRASPATRVATAGIARRPDAKKRYDIRPSIPPPRRYGTDERTRRWWW